MVTDKGQSKYVYEFKNIPYAVPPLGNRRWRPPLRMNKKDSTCWSGTLKYNNQSVVCIQKYRAADPIIGQEDCLLLDIRTPTVTKKANLPVVVWIHGGGLLWASKGKDGAFPGLQYTASLDAVTISVNYRLNVFGFLSLEELWIKSGDDESYGNYGIMDLIISLKWIRDNIHNFGGDPNHVTIFGQSGGAAAAFALLASPQAHNLFRKVITASGIANIRVLTHPG